MPIYQNLRFATGNAQFFATLSQRVNQYFKDNNISKQANGEMVVKTIFMIALYFTPYILMLTGVLKGNAQLFAGALVMGLGMAGIGLSIMHDANHGSYSSNQKLNNFLGLTLNLVGGHSLNWKIQHNVLHHTYTNVHDADEDISPRGILRMAPGSTWKPMHKFQHIYAWLFYGLLTFVWITAKDFSRLIRYQKEGLLERQKASPVKEWIILLLTKVIYVAYICIIPMYVLNIGFGTWFVGFLAMHYISGFILAIIFQPAHVVDGTVYPEPDPQGNLENNWAIHQLQTTTNFAPASKWFTWYVGGLNFQIEHHLFTNISHVHYKKIAPIVEEAARQYGIPYNLKSNLKPILLFLFF
jgi:linoleoyl-CoA desaturase